MSLLDNMRQTLTDAAENALEKGQIYSEQARLQVAMKKLQLERARRLHELGARTFDWYQSGSLTVSGAVPSQVTDICRQLADLKTEIDASQLQLDEVRRRAEEQGIGPAVPPPVTPDTASIPPADMTPAPATPTSFHDTRVLPDPNTPHLPPGS